MRISTHMTKGWSRFPEPPPPTLKLLQTPLVASAQIARTKTPCPPHTEFLNTASREEGRRGGAKKAIAAARRQQTRRRDDSSRGGAKKAVAAARGRRSRRHEEGCRGGARTAVAAAQRRQSRKADGNTSRYLTPSPSPDSLIFPLHRL
jgi:hypothetical protein